VDISLVRELFEDSHSLQTLIVDVLCLNDKELYQFFYQIIEPLFGQFNARIAVSPKSEWLINKLTKNAKDYIELTLSYNK